MITEEGNVYIKRNNKIKHVNSNLFENYKSLIKQL